ncbi:unnamed protein product [Bursaphelenchus xylophilus]|uniref:Glycosyltransferase family 92 protein n=1 Tax=Bursaphelenchus xylophilus TaxID=6326 RepID=A0A811KCX0_BURXY|nr:unnamed protein product [Bursaphelenchus xylophilus]CAG9091971.1 unnamed protein product [Bursaphelenchus xylophilus]
MAWKYVWKSVRGHKSYTNEPIADVPDCNVQDTEIAVQAARQALLYGRMKLPAKQRVHAANFNNPLRPYAVFLNLVPDTPRYEWRRRQQLSFRCISDKNEVADAEYRDSDGGTDCSWKNYYFVCEFTKPALSVRLVDQEGFGPRVLVKQPVTGEIPLVACLSRTFYYENWQVMLTVLEMYKAMGVSELSIHILNIVKEVFNILKQYEDEINLKIHPGFLIPKIRGRSENPNFQTETMNQIMCYNDCLYNYREAADFLIFTDMDDLIIPENGDLLTKARQILQRFPLAASMEFAWTTSNFNGVAHPNQFSIPRLLSGVTHHVEAYGKSTVIRNEC